MKRRIQEIKQSFIAFFVKVIKNYRKFLIIWGILFLIAFITGIFTASEYSKDLTCENLINIYLYGLLKRETTYFSFFLTMAIYYIFLSLYVYFTTKNRLMVIINTIIIMLASYIYGFDLFVIFVCLGLSGIIIGFITLGIMGLCVAFLFLLMYSIIVKNNLNKSCESREDKLQVFKVSLLLISLSVLILFLISLVFSIIHIFVIVE